MKINNPINKFHFTIKEAYATFIIDERLFTPDLAKEWIRNYYDWADKEAEPMGECLLHIAFDAIKRQTCNQDFMHHIITEMETTYDNVYTLRGDHGVTLIDLSGIKFPMHDIEVGVYTVMDQEKYTHEEIMNETIRKPMTS